MPSTYWVWFILSLAVPFAVLLLRPRHVNNGLISRWLFRIVRAHTPARRLTARLTVTTVLFVLLIAHLIPPPVYFGAFVVLGLDDYLNGGDDDTWRKRRERARNKIRWRMALPQPKEAA